MINVAISASRVAIVGAIAVASYAVGRIHGSKATAKIFADNLRAAGIEILSGLVIAKEAKLMVLRDELKAVDPSDQDAIAAVQSKIDDLVIEITKLNEMIAES